MDEGAICKITGEGGREVTRSLASKLLQTFIMSNYQSLIWVWHRGTHATNDEISKVFSGRNAKKYQQLCIDLQGLPNGKGIKAI